MVRNRYLDDFINGAHPIIDTQYRVEEDTNEVMSKQPVVRVIIGGPTLVEDSN